MNLNRSGRLWKGYGDMANKIVKTEDLTLVAGALSSPTRVRIVQLLLASPLNVTEIAEKLEMPVSSAISAVIKLEEAGLISSFTQGKKKICVVNYQAVILQLTDAAQFRSELDDTIYRSIPVGDYYNFAAVPSCGLLGDKRFIGPLDESDAFLSPNRVFARLVWLRKGFLEYRISKPEVDGKKIKSISVSLEICSEFPGYNNNFPSEIDFSINNQLIGVWNAPGDYGGRYGIFTPHWWGLNNTQFGDLVTCCVTGEGSFINTKKTSQVNVDDLQLDSSDYITLKIGTDSNGGFNLFGKNFGDYNQDIAIRIDLSDSDTKLEEDVEPPPLPNNTNYDDYIADSVKRNIK